MKITRHAKTRLKERNGFNKKATDRMAKKALEEGIPYSRTKGRLHQWLTAKYFKNRNASNTRVYGDKAYIFDKDTLITVLQIPANIMKDLDKMIIKEDTNE